MIIPTEIRLNIYGFVFGADTAILEAQYIASENRDYSYFTSQATSITNPANMHLIGVKIHYDFHTQFTVEKAYDQPASDRQE
jgi:hypothetical protein